MPRKMNDSAADLFSEEEAKTYRSAKKMKRTTKKECRHSRQTQEDSAQAVPLIRSLAPAAARNQRDSYAGRVISTFPCTGM